jgi:hypothetical protein
MADLVFNDRFMITDAGGHAIKLINKTGSASVKGTLVKAGTVDGSFIITAADEAMPIGVVYQAGIADGGVCWVVTLGIAEVLLENTTASTAGYWCRTSVTVAGRCTMNTASPPGGGITELDRHEREIGHCIESKAQGANVIAKCVMHFN